MTKNYKHYTFQEYVEQFSSFQECYDYYFEMQKEIDTLSEYNLHLVKSIVNYEDLLHEKSNRISKANLPSHDYGKSKFYPKEDKKIEKLIIYDDSINWCCNNKAINDTEKYIIDKINEIIDKINGDSDDN